MKIYMIHEVNNNILKIINSLENNCILTFDDGLYSSFKYFEHYKRFARVIFFVSSSIICESSDKQSSEFITCSEAHKKAFNNIFENYMTLEQIKYLQTLNFEIGSHSHKHLRFKSINEHIQDINQSLDFFSKHGINIKSYCFPYNQDFKKPYLNGILKSKFPNLEFFGANRINILNLNPYT